MTHLARQALQYLQDLLHIAPQIFVFNEWTLYQKSIIILLICTTILHVAMDAYFEKRKAHHLKVANKLRRAEMKWLRSQVEEEEEEFAQDQGHSS